MYRCEGNIPELVTGRLRLRKLNAGDAAAMFRCWTDEQTALFLHLPPLMDTKGAEKLIADMNMWAEEEAALRWGIELQGTGLIGSCGFNEWQLQGANRGEFGCELASPYWGRGLMKEAASVVLDYGFEVMGLNRIEAFTDVRNERGSGFFTSFGFQHEGILRDYRHNGNAYITVNVYSLLRREREGAKPEC